MESVTINTEYITLDQFLKYINVVGSGGEGKMLIKSGLVRVNGEVELRRGRKLRPGDIIAVENIGEWKIVQSGV
ncbi:MAG: S4 domain-containing protein YaaA [Firmicutes bacterium]|nr:S4 domain-containing protein YaaA [Bacillota bacterium]